MEIKLNGGPKMNKRKLILVMTAVMMTCIVLVGCTTKKTNNTNDSGNTGSTGVTCNESGAVGKEDLTGGEMRMLRINNYQEYRELVESVMPDNAIKYDSLKSIGEFSSFYMSASDFEVGDFSKYCMYDLTDSAGCYIGVIIRDISVAQKFYRSDALMIDYNKKDMRTLNEKKSGAITVDGVEYYYVDGRLLSIGWTQGSVKIALVGDEFLCDYPKGHDTFVSKLLDSDTAVEQVNGLRNES